MPAVTKTESLGARDDCRIALPDVFGATSKLGQLPHLARENPGDGGFPCPDLSRQSFSKELWGRVKGMSFRMIKENPFLVALLDGSLDPESFQCYLSQNLFYLRWVSRGGWQ